jgi:hypothetical protein
MSCDGQTLGDGSTPAQVTNRYANSGDKATHALSTFSMGAKRFPSMQFVSNQSISTLANSFALKGNSSDPTDGVTGTLRYINRAFL